MRYFDKLGFSWDQSAVLPGVSTSFERSVFRYKQMLAQFVFDVSALESIPLTYPEVKALMEGVTAGGPGLFELRRVFQRAIC